MIVSTGTFAEQVTITAANGNVTLEAAPGVEANVDAVLQGDRKPRTTPVSRSCSSVSGS